MHECAIDVAVAEEAEIVGADSDSLAQGLKPGSNPDAHAALKRRATKNRSYGGLAFNAAEAASFQNWRLCRHA
ncbi:MAG: hypothetical protein WA824_08225 [Candidatus Sulfotelmatobacter sp.]